MSEELLVIATTFFKRMNRSERARELLSIADMRIACIVEDGESFYVDVEDGTVIQVGAGSVNFEETDPSVLSIKAPLDVWRAIFKEDTTPGNALYENQLHIPTKMGKQNLTAAVTAAMRSVQGISGDFE